MASPHKDDARGCPVNNQEVQNSSVSIFTTINSTSPNSTITTSNTNSTINISSGATGQGFPVNAHDHTQSAELNETHGHGDAVRMEVRGQNGNPIIEDFDLDELNLHLPRVSNLPRELFYDRPRRLGIIQGALQGILDL